MSGAVHAERRYVRGRRCPICNGAAGDPRGAERRCHGFLSDDGYAHCSREEHAGALKPSEGSNTYGHRLAGLCECGKLHGEATPAESSMAPGQSSLGQIVATYDYHDEAGELLYQVVRLSPKEFRQRRPDPDRPAQWIWKLGDVRRVLYRLDRVLEADPALTVYVVEGEKDVEALEALGLVATCNPQGAGKWSKVADCAGTALKGRRVVVIADADESGRRHAADVEARLRGVAASVRVIEPPRGKDAADWIKAGGTVEEIKATAASTAADAASDAPALEITTPAKPRWLTPLTEFIGKDEPDDDDSEDWIIRDFIPRGEPALLVGPPKSGKTWALLDLAIAVATGTDWLGGVQKNTLGRPGRVLGVVLEDSLRRLGKRTWRLCRGRGIRPNEDRVLGAHLSLRARRCDCRTSRTSGTSRPSSSGGSPTSC
jgi:5S rRNA maturation endonuclease (ribonuclease M5)